MTKPNPENCKNCSSKCAYDCAQLQYTIRHRTVLIISPLTSRDNYHSSDVVYQKGGGKNSWNEKVFIVCSSMTFVTLAYLLTKKSNVWVQCKQISNKWGPIRLEIITNAVNTLEVCMGNRNSRFSFFSVGMGMDVVYSSKIKIAMEIAGWELELMSNCRRSLYSVLLSCGQLSWTYEASMCSKLPLVVVFKKETKTCFVITPVKLGRFQWNLVRRFLNRFASKWCKSFPQHLNNVSTLPCETWNAHCSHATTELLQKETPEFIPP